MYTGGGSSKSAESDKMYADNVKRAHDLRSKAQQLAKDELAIMNQAVDLNLLAKQLAENTMRPNIMPTSQHFYISLPAGLSSPAGGFKMQVVRPPGMPHPPQSTNLQLGQQQTAAVAVAGSAAGAVQQTDMTKGLPAPSAAAAAAEAAAAAAGGPIAGGQQQQQAAAASQSAAVAVKQQLIAQPAAPAAEPPSPPPQQQQQTAQAGIDAMQNAAAAQQQLQQLLQQEQKQVAHTVAAAKAPAGAEGDSTEENDIKPGAKMEVDAL